MVYALNNAAGRCGDRYAWRLETGQKHSLRGLRDYEWTDSRHKLPPNRLTLCQRNVSLKPSAHPALVGSLVHPGLASIQGSGVSSVQRA